MEGFWRGFGKFFRYNFHITLIYFSCYNAYRVGKDFGTDLEELLIVFTRFFNILDSCLHDFGGNIGTILLLLLIRFRDSFQMMRSLCQKECEADVSGNLRNKKYH